MSQHPFQQCKKQGEGWLEFEIPSKSHPGTTHQVLLPPWDFTGKEGVCDCDGFRFKKGFCSHIEAAKEMVCQWNELDGPEVQTAEQRNDRVCPRCGCLTTIEIADITD